jgi:nitrate/TMAO reductase-like tetraheme cytochrome c subunit
VISQFSHTCLTCHSNVAWKPATFNHSTTSFPLLGAHLSAACTDCHKNGVYKGTSTDCFFCHQTDYAASKNPAHATANFPTACISCHTTTKWVPSTFNHALYFPIASGDVHRPGRWSTCTAECHTNTSNFKVFSCITCHEHNKTSMDSKHSGRTGYLYDSNSCYKCHPKGRN